MLMFANPIFLWALGLISVPIIIHLLNRHRVKVMEWAAMQFILDIMEEQTKRFKIEDLLVLILRCLLVLFIALAFCRPALKNIDMPWLGGDGVGVIMMDDSYSMATDSGVGKRIEQAREKVIKVLNTAPAPLLLSLSLARSTPEDVFAEFSEDRPLMIESIREGKAQPWSSSAEAILRHGFEKLKTSKSPARSLFVVSDFQTDQWAKPSPGMIQWLEENQNEMHVVFLPVGDSSTENAGIGSFELLGGGVRVGQQASFSTTVLNHGREDLSGLGASLSINGQVVSKRSMTIPAGKSATVFFVHDMNQGGEHVATLKLDDDVNGMDNERRLSFSVTEKLPILIIHSGLIDEKNFQTTDFIELALNPFEDGEEDPRALYSFKHINMAMVQQEHLNDYMFVVVNDVAMMTKPEAERLETYVEGGGGIVWFVSHQAETEVYNSNLYRDGHGLLPFELKKEPIQAAEGEVLNREISFRDHPLWKYLLRGKTDYTDQWRIFKARRFVLPDPVDNAAEQTKATADEQAKVSVLVKALDTDGHSHPLLFEAQRGQGRVIFFAVGAGADDHNLPLAPAWPAFIIQLADRMMENQRQDISLPLGEIWIRPIPDEGMETAYRLKTPDDDLLTIHPEKSEQGGHLKLDMLNQTGIYHLKNSKEDKDQIRFSLFSRPEEGAIAAMTTEELKAVYEPYGVVVDGSLEMVEAFSALSSAPDLSLWMLMLALLCLIAEQVLVQRIARRNR